MTVNAQKVFVQAVLTDGLALTFLMFSFYLTGVDKLLHPLI